MLWFRNISNSKCHSFTRILDMSFITIFKNKKKLFIFCLWLFDVPFMKKWLIVGTWWHLQNFVPDYNICMWSYCYTEHCKIMIQYVYVKHIQRNARYFLCYLKKKNSTFPDTYFSGKNKKLAKSFNALDIIGYWQRITKSWKPRLILSFLWVVPYLCRFKDYL